MRREIAKIIRGDKYREAKKIEKRREGRVEQKATLSEGGWGDSGGP